MGVNPTPTNYKSFTFDGKSSREFGVYTTGEGVFNSPERDVEMISIPARNGEYALDKGHFNNIEVTYNCGIVADTDADFAEAISDFRNWLCSRQGYCRLEDEYNPDEYRMGLFREVVEVDHEGLRTGEFEITFDCKPQRWLKNGETAVTIGEWGETETVSGEVVEVEATEADAVKSLVADINPIQSGSGDPSPTNIRPISGHTEVDVVVSPTTDAADGNTYTTALGRTVYGGTLDLISGVLTVTHGIVDLSTLSWTWSSNYSCHYAGLSGSVGKPNNQVANCIAEKYATDSVSNVLANVGRIGIASNTTPPRVWVSTGAQANTPTGNLVYEFATPQTYQLTPQQIELLLGTNNIWADSGDVTLEYGQNPSVLVNPTLFEASPLLEVDGYGTIDFNGYSIELADTTLGLITLANSKRARTTTTSTLNNDLYRSGDNIKISTLKCSLGGIYFPWGGGEFTNVSATSTNPIFQVYHTEYSRDEQQDQVQAGVQVDNFSITAGTAKTESTLFTYSCDYDGDTVEATAAVSVVYTPGVNNDTITITNTITLVQGGNICDLGYSSNTISYENIQVNSTEGVLGHPTYIDCDIGECYMIKNNEILSLNQYIDLGSDLPTLSSGTNTFAYDNTVTDLKVVPRWWRV